MSTSRFYKLFHVDQPFDVTNRFQTSYILPPVVLAAIRLVISLYTLTTLIYRLAADDDKGRDDYLCYFTNLSYWGLAFYFLVAAFHGFRYHRTGSAPLQRWPRILQLLHGVLYTTIVNYPVLVTIVYWVLLAPTDSPLATTFSAWSNISVHALNSLFALFEIFLTRTERPPWIHLGPVILLVALYLGLAYLTRATRGFYPYSFLDPAKNGVGGLLGYIFGIFAGILVLFVVVWLVIWLRESIATKFRLEGKLAEKHAGGSGSNGSSSSIRKKSDMGRASHQSEMYQMV